VQTGKLRLLESKPNMSLGWASRGLPPSPGPGSRKLFDLGILVEFWEF